MDTARSLIPLIKPLRDNNTDFPSGFCDIVTATIIYVHKVKGAKTCCGKVEHTWHFWLKFGEINIDFTAHQFPSLERETTIIDGFKVMIGTDQEFKKKGYTIDNQSQCERELEAVAHNSILGKVGECSVALCLMD